MTIETSIYLTQKIMKEIINRIKSSAEREMAETLLEHEIESITGDRNGIDEESLYRQYFDSIYHNIIEKYEEKFTLLFREITDHLENTSYNNYQQEKAICIYIEIQGLLKGEQGFAYNMPEKDDLNYSKEKLTSFFSDIAKYFRFNQLLTPVSNYIERHYIEVLTDKSIFPLPVQNLLAALSNDNFQIVNNKTDKNGEEVTVYSIEYNGYNKLCDYKTHLNGLYAYFTQYLKLTNEIIVDFDKLELFYSTIREYLDYISMGFVPVISDELKCNTSGSLRVRKETETMVQDYFSGMFEDSIGYLSSDKLHRMMDTQYRITVSALNLVQAGINILKKKNEILKTNCPGNNESKIMLKIGADKFYFLMRMLIEEKILNEKVITKLLRMINRSFRTINQKELSVDSMRNKYYNADKNCANFWVEKFTHMKQRSMKVRDGGKW